MKTAPDIPQNKEEFRRFFFRTFYDYKYLLILCATYVLVLLMLGLSAGAKLSEYIVFSDLAILFAPWFALGYLARVLLLRVAAGTAQTQDDVFERNLGRWFTGQRAAIFLITYLVLVQSLLIGAAKSLIRIFNNYSWDPFFSNLDFTLHGGHFPHHFTQAFLSNWPAGYLFEYAYAGWYYYWFLTFVFCALFDKNRQRQAQFLWAHILSWIVLGSIMATIFSSVGPRYFAAFYPELANPYVDITLAARSSGGFIPNQTDIANLLYSFVRNTKIIDVNSISAFPSLHVATSWMFALYARSINKFYFISAAVFALLILISSVHFGWHYAIDGYVGIIFMQLIWWVSGRIARKQTSPE